MDDVDDGILPLSLASVCEMDDGQIHKDFDSELVDVCNDIKRRGAGKNGKSAKRKLVLELEVEGEFVFDRELGGYKLAGYFATPTFQSKRPKITGKRHEVKVRKGKLTFNRDNPEHHSQGSLPGTRERDQS